MKEPPSYAPVSTAAGDGFVAWGPRGVVSLDVDTDERTFVARTADLAGSPPRRSPLPADLARRIRAAVLGSTGNAPVDLSRLPAFQQKVLRATMKIPAGQVRSYGQIAGAIGHPRAARAVGTALGRNPIPLLVPCHRVVRGDGSIGEYGMGGTSKKRELLLQEGLAL